MPENFSIVKFVLAMVAVMLHITVHEFGHAYTAWRAGDDTPRAQGRISLNPIDHLDPIGTFMIVATSLTGMGFGWGKPVMVNPFNFKSPRWDNLRTSLAGPVMNLILSALVGLIARIVAPSLNANTALFVYLMIVTGIGLALFNLIPVGPLDGSHILSSLLPVEKARAFDMFMARYGMIVLLALLFLGPVRMVISPVAEMIFGLIAGPSGHILLVRAFGL